MIIRLYYETKYENILTHWSVAQVGSNNEKNRGRKSRWTAPLSLVMSKRQNVSPENWFGVGEKYLFFNLMSNKALETCFLLENVNIIMLHILFLSSLQSNTYKRSYRYLYFLRPFFFAPSLSCVVEGWGWVGIINLEKSGLILNPTTTTTTSIHLSPANWY